MNRFSKQEIRNRWYIFIAGMILLFLTSYFLAFSKTMKLYSRYNTVKMQSDEPNGSSGQLKVNTRDAAVLKEIISRYSVDTLIIKEKLLDEFSNLCAKYSCRINSIGETQHYEEFGMNVISNEMDIEGSYFQLLKIMNELENNSKVGKINSCEIYVVNDFVNKLTKLRMKLFIQNIRKDASI